MATKLAANCAKYCVIGNLALILQVIVADCFEKSARYLYRVKNER